MILSTYGNTTVYRTGCFAGAAFEGKGNSRFFCMCSAAQNSAVFLSWFAKQRLFAAMDERFRVLAGPDSLGAWTQDASRQHKRQNLSR
jgi:hypothetical protein